MVLEMSAPYRVRAVATQHGDHGESQDIFRNFVIPIPLGEARRVRAVEFRPSDSRVVHHAIIALDRSSSARIEETRDTFPGFDGHYSASQAMQPAGFVLGWTPGSVPRRYPDELAWTLEPGADFVVQAHLMPTDEEVDLQVRIGLHFGGAPIQQTSLVKNMYLLGTNIDIPAGEGHYTVQDSLRLPVDVEVLGLYPHAHYLARTVRLDATLPDSQVRTLLEIGRWDFDWQDMYVFEDPVSLPAGTQLAMRWVYDNSASNPRNPNQPPRRVSFGYGSTDEMGELWIQARPRRSADYAILQAAVDAKRDRDHHKLFRHAVAMHPTDAAAHANLGSSYTKAEQFDLAVEHYRRALDLRPDFARAWYELAATSELRGNRGEAVRGYEAAIAAFPRYVAAHMALGDLLARGGDAEGAAVHYREATEADPDNAEAHIALGNLASARRNLSEAVGHYRAAVSVADWAPAAHFSLARALVSLGMAEEGVDHLETAARLAPSDAAPRITVGWILAADPRADIRRPELAIRVAEGLRGSLGRDHPLSLDLMAAARAALGQFGRAERLASRALDHARSSGDDALARSIGERLRLYAQERPFLTSVGPYSSLDAHE